MTIQVIELNDSNIYLKPEKTLLQVDKNRCALLELDERSGGVFGGAENRFCSRSCRWSRFLVGLPSRLARPENLSPSQSNQLRATFAANYFRENSAAASSAVVGPSVQWLVSAAAADSAVVDSATGHLSSVEELLHLSKQPNHSLFTNPK